jgi:hypothetical protein
MKTVMELYPDYKGGYGPSDYQPILEEFGEIIIQVDDDNYQGDSRLFYRIGSGFGYLQFGWGSCSGCDGLQACNSIEDVQVLIDELKSQIHEFIDKEEALQYFENHDWEGDYSSSEKEQAIFVENVLSYLRGV